MGRDAAARLVGGADKMVWRGVGIRVCPRGEQHCGERTNMNVWAGPLAKQECEATLGQRTESGKRVRVAPLTRRRRARARCPNGPARQTIVEWSYVLFRAGHSSRPQAASRAGYSPGL